MPVQTRRMEATVLCVCAADAGKFCLIRVVVYDNGTVGHAHKICSRARRYFLPIRIRIRIRSFCDFFRCGLNETDRWTDITIM